MIGGGESSEKQGGARGWDVTDMHMLGTEAIFVTPEGVPVFPSDHFGLVASLALK
jgi:hypothetical protein